MKRYALSLVVIVLLAAGCGHESPRYGGGPPPTTGIATPGGIVHFDLDCTICHAAQVPPGSEQPGQTLPACNVAACHEHDPTGPLPAQVHQPAPLPGSACLDCHHAHTSSNILLVREQILTPSGERAVEFTDFNTGAGDGSFVSVTPPVRGVCQVCHTTTRFYRADGSGEPHFTFPCFTCHLHGAGFAPPPTTAATPTVTPTP
jgi:predicted CXXCH cytochrome family protein